MLISIFCLLIGLFCVICSVCNFDWFFNARKARMFVNLIGRTGARIFYIALGLFIIITALIVICSKIFAV